MGALTHGNVRVSLTRDTSAAEVDRLLAALPEVLDRLR
jgi:cysteine desulfurase